MCYITLYRFKFSKLISVVTIQENLKPTIPVLKTEREIMASHLGYVVLFNHHILSLLTSQVYAWFCLFLIVIFHDPKSASETGILKRYSFPRKNCFCTSMHQILSSCYFVYIISSMCLISGPGSSEG